MPQLAKFEAAVHEYEQLSSTEFNKRPETGSCSEVPYGPAQRRRPPYSLATRPSYSDLRSLIERWDASQTRWSASIASSYGLAASSSDKPQPWMLIASKQRQGMEVGKGPKRSSQRQRSQRQRQRWKWQSPKGQLKRQARPQRPPAPVTKGQKWRQNFDQGSPVSYLR